MSKKINDLLFQYLTNSSQEVFTRKELIYYSYIEDREPCLFAENKIVPVSSLFLYDRFIETDASPDKLVYYHYKVNKRPISESSYEKSYSNFFQDMKKQRLNMSFMKSKTGDNVVSLFNIEGTIWDLDTNELLVSLCVPNYFFTAFYGLNSSEDKKNFLDKNIESYLSLYIDKKFMTDDKYNTWRKRFETNYLEYVRMFDIDIIETANLKSKIFKTVNLLPKMNSLDDVQKYFSYMEDKLVEDILNT